MKDAHSASGMKMMDQQKSTGMKLAQMQLQAGHPDGSVFGYNMVGHQLHMWRITYPIDQSLSCVNEQSLLDTFHQQNKN